MSVARNPLSRLFSSANQRISGRVSTKQARFQLAVASGFVIATVGFLVVAADTHYGVAESIFGIEMPGIFGTQPQTYAQAPGPSPQYYTPRRHRVHAAEARHPAHVIHVARADSDDRPMSLSGKSMCVRLCDGFAFPVGDYHGNSDRASHEATCQSECPGARTALFVVPAGADSIGDATQVGTGQSYSELPDAFHYTTYIEGSCSCHPQGGNRIKSLLHDFTLRRGDSVMTSKGLQVFHGGSSFPFKRQDFVALSRSRDIRKSDRTSLKAIERASLVQPTTVAKTTSRPMPMAATSPHDGTKTLEHQAQN